MKFYCFIIILLFFCGCNNSGNGENEDVYTLSVVDSSNSVNKYILLSNFNTKSHESVIEYTEMLSNKISNYSENYIDNLSNLKSFTSDVKFSQDNHFILFFWDFKLVYIHKLNNVSSSIIIPKVNYYSISGELKSNYINIIDQANTSIGNITLSNASIILQSNNMTLSVSNCEFNNVIFNGNRVNGSISLKNVNFINSYLTELNTSINILDSVKIDRSFLANTNAMGNVFSVFNSNLYLNNTVVKNIPFLVSSSNSIISINYCYFENVNSIFKTNSNTNLIFSNSYVNITKNFLNAYEGEAKISKSIFWNFERAFLTTRCNILIEDSHFQTEINQYYIYERNSSSQIRNANYTIRNCNIIVEENSDKVIIIHPTYSTNINLNDIYIDFRTTDLYSKIQDGNTLQDPNTGKVTITNRKNSIIENNIGIK